MSEIEIIKHCESTVVKAFSKTKLEKSPFCKKKN